MRKIYSFAAAAMCTLSVAAGNYEVLNEINRDALRELKPAKLEMAPATVTAAKAMAFADNAPSSLVGKSYVNVYSDGDTKYNGVIDIIAAGDSIVLGGFVEGYDVKAAYDAVTGTITIPTGYVIANHSTYGPITMWALDVAAETYSSNPIIGTVDGNTITFNLGVYSTITMDGKQYYISWMQDMKATEANGSMTLTSGTTNFSIPLSVTKTSETSISVVGISSLLYGGYYSVPVNFDASANTATISRTQPVDVQVTNSATNVYYLMGLTSSGSLAESAFTVSVTDNSTVVAATSNIGYVYPASTDALTGQTSYSGYKFSNFKINVDFNIYTAKVEGGSTEFDPNPTIENINYTLDPETKTAEVTGCMTGIATITIPSNLSIQGINYTVTSVKEGAFTANRAITTLSLPATLKTVGKDAFRNVTNLRLLYIEDMAAWCGVVFANGNANPIYNVFPTLERNWGKVYFNNTLFEGELTIPTSVTSIGRAFYGLKSLTKINLPEGLKTIGDQTFGNATKLTEVSIPSSVTSVGSAFFGCSALATVNLAEGLESMGSNMFYGCKALASVTIPSSVKSIGSMTFSDCQSLTEIAIPASVDTIANMAFYGCDKITKVKSFRTLPPACGIMVFDDCSEATLMVPAEAIDAYKAATGWSVFTKVGALQTTGVDAIEADVNVPAEYYNLQGQKVAAESLVPGIYVVRQGNKVTKTYVK